jgi:hypothetical protein
MKPLLYTWMMLSSLSNVQEQFENPRKMFQRFRKARHILNTENSQLFQKEVRYIVLPEEVATDLA